MENSEAESGQQGSASQAADVDVVVVGAGLAGLVAAHDLRDRRIVVLEKLDRAGGRTFSGSHGEYWFNLGAQFVWDKRTVDLCHQLDVGLLAGHGARASIYLRGKLVTAPNPYLLFARMPLSARERLNLALTITRLRWLARKLAAGDSDRFDSGSLRDLMGKPGPMTTHILDLVSISGTGIDAATVSGRIGLGYAIHLFGGDVNHTLKQVVGGTQSLAEALVASLGEERVLLGATVDQVKCVAGGVSVTYTRQRVSTEVVARSCILAVPPEAVLHTVQGLTSEKTAALERMLPPSPLISTAWLTNETSPMPWDDLLMTPVIDELSFEQVSNNAYFLRRQHVGPRQAGGCVITVSGGDRAEQLSGLSDDEVRRRIGDDLALVFPSAASVLADAEVRVARWQGLPAFKPNYSRDRGPLRSPLGPIHFCGDYTAQPGTPGAVGSGYHTAKVVRAELDRANGHAGGA